MVNITASEEFHQQCMECKIVLSSNTGMAKKSLPIPKRKFRKTFVREWRIHRGLTIEQLADRVDMTEGYLSMFERGQRGYTQNTLEALADALQTDAASLIMRDPSQPDAIWSVWDQAKEGDRAKIVSIAETIIGKTGTSD